MRTAVGRTATAGAASDASGPEGTSGASPPGSVPRSARFDARKEEILNAAGAVFNRHGLRDATLGVVAAEIGLNLKSLRHYYRRREDLVAAAFLRSISLHRGLAEEALQEVDVERRVRRFVRSYFDLQAEVREKRRPEFVHFGDVRALAEPHASEIASAYTQMFRAVRALLRTPGRQAAKARLNAAAHMLFSQLLWSVVWVRDYPARDYARVADRLADILLGGLASQAPEGAAGLTGRPEPLSAAERLSPDAFLQAATALINRFGYRGAAVDRISKELNVTKGAFYHHNETRDGLVFACFQRTFARVREVQDVALDQRRDGLHTVIDAAGTLLVRVVRDDGALLRTSALTALAPDMRDRAERGMARLTLRFQAMLSDGVVDGSIRPCDVRVAAEMVSGLINSGEELARWAPEASASAMADGYLACLISGLPAAVG